MKFSEAVVKRRILILIIVAVLMIPSVLGMAATRINYDMLNYLPEDMDTVGLIFFSSHKALIRFTTASFTFDILCTAYLKYI